MKKDFSKEPTLLLPKAYIHVPDYDEITIGGLDTPGVITEVNFYSQLNSFAFNADITIDDVDNIILNKITETHGVKVVISMYELPENVNTPFIKIDDSVAVKIFQKEFAVDYVEVKKFGITYPYKSVIKIHLIDTFEALLLNKLVHYSNFNIEWESKEMDVDATIHKILEKYEDQTDKTVINNKIFGVEDLTSLRRRFVTDQETPMKEVILDYLYSLYDTRWIEYLGKQPSLEAPQCLLAFTNQYFLDGQGMLKRTPYLTSVNLLDDNPGGGVYSVPYGGKGSNARIRVYAKPEYNLCIEDTSIDFRGSAGAEMKDRILATTFRKSTFNPHNNEFIDEVKDLEKVTTLSQPKAVDIESHQSPKYLGEGPDPKFSLMNYINEKQFIRYPYNVKENKYYYSDGSQSFYVDMADMMFKPIVYVSIPFAAWHSPGQEIDLRMINRMYADQKPEKDLFFSMNKLVSGRWKILNSVTNFKKGKENPNAFGMMPIETVGLGRTRYFHGEKEGK